MRKPLTASEFARTIDGKERCQECGHLWTDVGTAHYEDCRFYVIADHDELDQIDDEELAQLLEHLSISSSRM